MVLAQDNLVVRRHAGFPKVPVLTLLIVTEPVQAALDNVEFPQSGSVDQDESWSPSANLETEIPPQVAETPANVERVQPKTVTLEPTATELRKEK